jgi:type VI secretion system secreted protein Hcp
MKSPLLTLFIALCACLLPQTAFAQNVPSKIISMTIDGPNGVIQGEAVQASREGSHQILAYSHEIVSPRDAASGLPTGKRQHKPFTVVKYINRGSPLLLNAMAKEDALDVEITLWGTSPQTGQEVKVLTYRLSKAKIVAIRPWSPNKNDPDTSAYSPSEEISFTYQSIEVTFVNGGIIGQDDWENGRDAAKTVKPAPAKP